MSEKKITIRLETKDDYRAVENLTCESFWNVPTCILYSEHDNLTSIETVFAFAKRYHADLTVMPGGEHWFHTEEQMQFLDHWISERSLNDVCG